MSNSTLSEQEIVRRDNLGRLASVGIDPFPAEAFPPTHLAADVVAGFGESRKNVDEGRLSDSESPVPVEDASADPVWGQVRLTGRVMGVRIMGKAAFLELQDSSGRIQLYVSRDDIAPGEDKTLYNDLLKKWLDLGDFIGVEGFVFLTRTGEITLHVKHFRFLGKSLRPLPVVKRDDEGHVYDAFTDPELRYRMRYLDLTVNPQYKEIFVKRNRLVRSIQGFLDSRGMMEVETPILQPIHGGAAARPFKTHHNALDEPLFLRIANELYLKRLIVAGFDGVYEIGKMFRNEGMDRTHNPEFSMMELYVAYQDYFWMMDLTEQMLGEVAEAVTGSREVPYQGKTISFSKPFARIPILDAIEQYGGVEIKGKDEAGLREVCRAKGIHVEQSMGYGKLIDELFGELVEGQLIQPTFVIDYPVEMSPLTKKHRSKPGLVERFELIINGKEVANAYTELNDPIDQRERFEEQLTLAARGDDEAMALDEDFLRALEYGMPPTTGIGIGIDRLTMLLTDQVSIQEVLFFPQMRREKPDDRDRS